MARWDKHYRMDNKGFSRLMDGPKIGDMALEAAERGRRWAEADDPDGNYGAVRQNVPGGRDSAPRTGAALESRSASAGGRKRTLVRAVDIIEGKP